MSPRPKYGHFTPELFTYLRQLERNNRRDWFEKNRARYLDHVRDPMLRFIADLDPRLRRISPRLVVDPTPIGGSMFRIHRDTRFSKDKRPYKTAATARFPLEGGKDVHTPGYYVHLGTDGVYMASGLWHPDPVALAKIRRAIVADPAAWRRVRAARPFRTVHRFTGETLVRPPRGFDPEHPLIEDLKRKDFITFVQLDERKACAPDFLLRFAELCCSSAPLVRYLAGVLSMKW